MPTAAQLLARLSAQAEQIADAIEKRQAALRSSVSTAERDLFIRLVDDVFAELEFKNGIIVNNTQNLLLLYRLDNAFDAWQTEVINPLMRGFVADLFSIAEMTGAYYTDFAAEKVINDIATSNELLRASLGVDTRGNLIKGGLLADISKLPAVRQEAKMLFLQEVQKTDATLKDLQKTMKDFLRGKSGQPGAVNANFAGRASGYVYDLFNQVAEVKNIQFAENLDLKWFIYTGDIIKDSREFCIKKAGKVFATIEAETEWPKDPDLIGKGSGIPYVPLVQRGRWNCRHRIRYISEEIAMRLDADKVKAVKEKYSEFFNN